MGWGHVGLSRHQLVRSSASERTDMELLFRGSAVNATPRRGLARCDSQEYRSARDRPRSSPHSREGDSCVLIPVEKFTSIACRATVLRPRLPKHPVSSMLSPSSLRRRQLWHPCLVSPLTRTRGTLRNPMSRGGTSLQSMLREPWHAVRRMGPPASGYPGPNLPLRVQLTQCNPTQSDRDWLLAEGSCVSSSVQPSLLHRCRRF
jgi:hypothetical protein